MEVNLSYLIEFISIFRVFFATIKVLFMKSFFQVIALIGTFSVSTLYAADKPQVELQTNKGVIVFELMPDKSPKSVENFLLYVKDGFYTNTILHRVIPDYMIQGGGYDDKQTKKETTHPAISNEAENGVKNTKGTVAVARKNEAHSGTSQFFINMKDNPQLNHTGKTDSKTWGYAVFAKVTKGMDILEQIQDLETNQEGPFKYFPVEPVIIESVTLKEEAKPSKKAVGTDKKTDAKLDKEDKKSEKKDKKSDKKDAAKEDDQAAKDAAEDAADAAAEKSDKKADKKSDKKSEKKADKKDAAKEDDQAAKDAAEDAADAAAAKAEEKKADKKDAKASTKKVEKKDEKKELSEEEQAAKDAAEDAADAAAAKAEEKKADKKDEKKSEKKVEKKSEKKDEKAKTKDAGDAPDEPAAE
jgi:cyclophilin family peptidyl-prolyl cis-trans isomerase